MLCFNIKTSAPYACVLQFCQWSKRVGPFRICSTVYAWVHNDSVLIINLLAANIFFLTLFIVFSVRIIPYSHRAHRHLRPPPAKQPDYKRIQTPPVCGDDVQEDATVRGHKSLLLEHNALSSITLPNRDALALSQNFS